MDIYLINPRVENKKEYLQSIHGLADYSDNNGYCGTLLFTGNDTLVEPWALAQSIIQRTNSVQPLIAVNPIYMHPYTVAKFVASIDMLYDRKVALNFVTGLSKTYLSALGDTVEHDNRYVRLKEYINVVNDLLVEASPLTLLGNHYKLSQLSLEYRPQKENLPSYFLSGGSEAASTVCLQGLNTLRVLPIDADQKSEFFCNAVYFGIVTRPNKSQAITAAERMFPDSQRNKFVFEHTMKHTDSQWKRRLKVDSEHALSAANGYWLGPFVNYQTDCPYLVGDYDYVANMLNHLKSLGVTTMIIDTPWDEETLYHMNQAVRSSGVI